MRTMLPAGSWKAQSRMPYGCSVGSWTASAPLACSRSKVPSRSLVARVTMAYVPLAIISTMVRRSLPVMPGPAPGGYRTMDVPGWPPGPTVIQRIPPYPTSLRTSKPRCRARRPGRRPDRHAGGRSLGWIPVRLVAARCVPVEEDGVGVAVAACLPDSKGPLVGVAEVLDAAELDGVVVVVAEVAGQVAVGAAPGDGDFFQRGPALGGVMVDGSLDEVLEAPGGHGHGVIVAGAGVPPPGAGVHRASSGDHHRSPGGRSWRVPPARTS